MRSELREPVECVFRFPQRECGIAFMDFCGVVAYDFLNKHRRDSGFMQKGGGCVAEGVEGEGVFVPGFVLGGAVLFCSVFRQGWDRVRRGRMCRGFFRILWRGGKLCPHGGIFGPLRGGYARWCGVGIFLPARPVNGSREALQAVFRVSGCGCRGCLFQSPRRPM